MKTLTCILKKLFSDTKDITVKHKDNKQNFMLSKIFPWSYTGVKGIFLVKLKCSTL
jgi:hypothetical protein